MKIDLDQYGILEGINETIITTISQNGRFNAAPIGIIRRDGKLMARIYNESHTGANIKDTGLLAANMVYDPVLFVQSALAELGDKMFETINIDKYGVIPILNKSSAWIIFRADFEKGSKTIQAELYPIKGEIRRSGITNINRGFYAVIEATIAATRYIVFRDEKYIRKIKTYKPLIDKCGGTREKQAYELLIQLL